MCQNPNPSSSPQPDPSSSHDPNPRLEEGNEEQEHGEEMEDRYRDLEDIFQAARDVRRFALDSSEVRSANAVVKSLGVMLSSPDGELSKLAALLAILNLSTFMGRNNDQISRSGVASLFTELRSYKRKISRELAISAVLSPSASTPVNSAGAVPELVQFLSSGSISGKVNTVTLLYSLSSSKDSSSGGFSLPSEAVKPLLALLNDCKEYSRTVEKATRLLEILSTSEEDSSISEFDGGIQTLVDTIEDGSSLAKEYAVGVLLALCDRCPDKYKNPILREGAIPWLLLLKVEGTEKAKDRARRLLDLLMPSPPKRETLKNLEALAYDFALKVEGPEKAAETAKWIIEEVNRRRMEFSSTELQH